MGDESLTVGLKGKEEKEIEGDKEEVCRGDTDPVMTAAGSANTRGSGLFCVSLDSGRKVGKKYRVKAGVTGTLSAKPKPFKITSVCLSPNGCHKHLQMLAF